MKNQDLIEKYGNMARYHAIVALLPKLSPPHTPPTCAANAYLPENLPPPGGK